MQNEGSNLGRATLRAVAVMTAVQLAIIVVLAGAAQLFIGSQSSSREIKASEGTKTEPMPASTGAKADKVRGAT
jgi:hypothetical protein